MNKKGNEKKSMLWKNQQRVLQCWKRTVWKKQNMVLELHT